MSNSIKLSKKYGVNPTIPVCFFCGEHKNEIALMGHIGDYRKWEDIEAPSEVVLDYEPCEHCKEQFSKGVLVVSVTPTPNQKGQPPIAKGAYPTGAWAVVKPEALVDGNFKAGDATLAWHSHFMEMFKQKF